jgi:hypothetical protein
MVLFPEKIGLIGGYAIDEVVELISRVRTIIKILVIL